MIYKINEDKKGVEIYFDAIPSESTRDDLKAQGWRWSRFAGCWYNKQTADNIAYAASLAGGAEAEPAEKTSEKKPFELSVENLKKCIDFDKWDNGRGWSDAATVARACKKFLKKAGIECRTKSQQFAGGDSVTVDCDNLTHEQEKKIKSILSSVFQAGDVNCYTDIYEYRANPENLPRTSYFFFNNYLSVEFQKAAVAFFDKKFTNNPYSDCLKIDKVFRGDFKNYEDVPRIEQYR